MHTELKRQVTLVKDTKQAYEAGEVVSKAQHDALQEKYNVRCALNG